MLKDHTSNSLLPAITTFNGRPSRLHVITGKGGVGKTTLAMALAKSLNKNGHKVLYNSFDIGPKKESLEALGIPYFELTPKESMKEYMGRKLKSEMIAGWIMNTPFFSSLLNMIPALGQMILLGHIINKLNEDPELHIVIDAPASGHSLTLFQSTHNFKDMFKEGLLVEDINKMHNFMHAKGNLEIWIATLPTRMAIQEGRELADHLGEMGLKNIKFLANVNLSAVSYIQKNLETLPYFLKQKANMEVLALKEIQESNDLRIGILPYFTDVKFEDVINSAESFIEKELKWR